MTSPRLLGAIAALDRAIDATRGNAADMDTLAETLLGLAASFYRGDVARGSVTRDEARVMLVEAALDAWDRVSEIADAEEAVTAAGGEA